MPPRRRLSLSDWMALIGSTAVGLAACQSVVRGMPSGRTTLGRLLTIPDELSARVVVFLLIDTVVIALTVFGPWTFVLPALRLSRPRPPLHRLTRQPGFTAGLAALVGLLAGFGMMALTITAREAMPGAFPWVDSLVWLRQFLLDELIIYMGTAVLVAWTMQAISGRWRPEPDTSDRLGRAVGFLWIVSGLAWGVRRYLLSV